MNTTKLLEPRGLTKEALRQSVPAIFATAPDSRVSAGYSFIPTEPLFDACIDQGLICTGAQMQMAGRGGSSRVVATAAHLLRFRHAEIDINYQLDGYPEVILLNSHDRTKRLMILAGIFRVFCSNGMIIGDAFFPPIRITHYHVGQTVDELVGVLMTHASKTAEIHELMDRMRKFEMSDERALKFAQAAITARYGTYKTSLDPKLLLNARRPEDENPTLWNVFNRVQEHLSVGGLQTGRSWTRPMASLQENIVVNRKLWALAAETMSQN